MCVHTHSALPRTLVCALKQVPVLGRDVDIPVNSLVRFRGMVVDMPDPEFYFGSLKYKDGTGATIKWVCRGVRGALATAAAQHLPCVLRAARTAQHSTAHQHAIWHQPAAHAGSHLQHARHRYGGIGAMRSEEEPVDSKVWERRPLRCIPVPGESSWASPLTGSAPATVFVSGKRPPPPLPHPTAALEIRAAFMPSASGSCGAGGA